MKRTRAHIPRRVKWFMQHGRPDSPRRKRLVLRWFRRINKAVKEADAWVQAGVPNGTGDTQPR